MVLERIVLNTAAVAGPEIGTFWKEVQQELLGGFPGATCHTQEVTAHQGQVWLALKSGDCSKHKKQFWHRAALKSLSSDLPFLGVSQLIKVISKQRVKTSNSSNY